MQGQRCKVHSVKAHRERELARLGVLPAGPHVQVTVQALGHGCDAPALRVKATLSKRNTSPAGQSRAHGGPVKLRASWQYNHLLVAVRSHASDAVCNGDV